MKHTIILATMPVLLIGCDVGPPTPQQGVAGDPKALRVIEFWAPWCGPCKTMKPIIDQYESHTGRKIERVNVDEHLDLATQFEVSAIPTIVVIRGDEVVDKKIGVLRLEELRKWLAPYDQPLPDKAVAGDAGGANR